jgi:isopenicillin-N epimerase
MATAFLPPIPDPVETKRRLYDDHRIEVPLTKHDNRFMIRMSFQAYNDEHDLDRLLAALTALGITQS